MLSEYIIAIQHICRNPGELNPLLENSNVLQGDNDIMISLTSHRFIYLSCWSLYLTVLFDDDDNDDDNDDSEDDDDDDNDDSEDDDDNDNDDGYWPTIFISQATQQLTMWSSYLTVKIC
jgi:hypothetical protein